MSWRSKTNPGLFVAAYDAPAKDIAAADYVCDGAADELQINAALLLGNVRLSTGTFDIAGSIIVPSGVTLEGCGESTKIYRITSATGATLAEDLDNSETAIDVSNGDLFLAGQTIKIDTEEFYIVSIAGNTLTVNTRPHNNSTAATHSSGAAIKFEGAVIRNANTMGLVAESANVTVKNIWIDAGDDDADVAQTSSPGIEIRKCNRSTVEGCHVQNTCGHHPEHADMDTFRGIGIALDDSDYCTVRKNKVTLCSHGAISIRNNCHHCNIEGNYCYNTGYEGIVVCNKTFGTSSATGEGCSDINIIGNQVWDCGTAGTSAGIYTEDQATSGDGNPHYRVNIVGNVVRTIAAGVMTGILILRQAGTTSTPVYCNIANNVIADTLIGVKVDNSPKCSIVGNSIKGTTTYAGISVSSSNYTAVVGNSCSDALGASGGNGIGLSASNYCIISGNILTGNASHQFYMWDVCTDNQITGNIITTVSDKSCIMFGAAGQARNLISGNKLVSVGTGNSGHGIYLPAGADYNSITNNTIGDTNDSGTPTKKAIDCYSSYNIISGNKFTSISPANSYYYGIRLENGTTGNLVQNNDMRNGYKQAALYDTGAGNLYGGGNKPLLPGEITTIRGSIVTLTENAFNSVDNPFGQNVALLSLDIYVSTKATSTEPNIDCGIGSSATADYVTLFQDLPGETVGLYNSKIATPGAQTQPILWQTGTGNRYLNMSIKDAAATGMVATYVATVMGL